MILRGLVSFFIGVTCIKADPCKDYFEFPHEDRRDVDYELADSESPISDQYIEEGWYGSAMTIATAPPGDYMCGTFFPIWAKEVVSNDDGTQSVEMCTVDTEGTCADPFVVKAKNCGAYTVYNLIRTAADSAYCLGPKDGDKPERTNKPGVTTDLLRLKDGKSSELTFYCDFNKSDQDVFYMIYWYVESKHVKTSTPQKWPVDHEDTNRLDEATLKENGWVTVGFNVYCAVRASYEIGKAASVPVFSESKFVGIKVHNTLVNLGKDPVDISFQLTAPFGCIKQPCTLDIRVKEEKQNQNGNCGQRLLRLSDCGVQVKHDEWDKIHKLTIKPKTIIETYDNVVSTVHLKLALNKNNLHHRIWAGDYATGDIVVETVLDKSLIKGKSCHATSDPHMETLDGRYYEHQYGGIFTLYTNENFEVEVQVETSRCNYGNRAYCVCGIAIRAGRSVFTVQKCPDRKRKVMYTLCDEDDVLDVRRNKTKYEILIPSGTIIKFNAGGQFMNVYVYPSIHDIGNSRGLCGKLSNSKTDDFILRNEKQSSDPDAQNPNSWRYISFPEFSESWRVDEENNLFKTSTFDKLLEWDRSKRYCDCNGCKNPPCDTVECAPKEQSRVCQLHRPEMKVDPKPKRCKTHAIKKRSVVEPKPASNQKINTPSIEKRDADDWLNGWTNETATKFCETQFSQSASIAVCRDIPTVNIDKSMDDCVLDIWLTGGTEFVSAAIDNVQSSCIQEVVMNTEFHNKTEGESILEKVLKVACPNECNGKGDCVNGVCRCVSGYSGPDCSVDLSSPPVITEVEDGGLCDINEDPCTVVSLFGETFVDSPSTTCKFRDIQEHDENINDSSTLDDDSSVNTAQVESMMEIGCKIPVPRRKRSVIGANGIGVPHAFYVSVSNNGALYSQESIVVIFNSTCQTCSIQQSTVTCTVADNYCTFGGQCIPKGGRFPLGHCAVCDVQGDKRTWQEDHLDPTCSCIKASNTWTLTVTVLVFILQFLPSLTP